MKESNRLTVIDFFCGAGGFSEGFRRAGYDVIMGIDNWQPAITTHNFNHGLNDNIKSVLDFENIEEIISCPIQISSLVVHHASCFLFLIKEEMLIKIQVLI